MTVWDSRWFIISMNVLIDDGLGQWMVHYINEHSYR